MQQPIVMQDWVTLRGQGGTPAVTFIPHRSRWNWSGDAQAVAVVIEVMELAGTTGAITLRLATAASETGPWFAVKSWTAPGDDRLYLRRDATLDPAQQFLGYLRWELVEAASPGPATGAWTACFRIVLVEETAD
jgi:hypothetical protein